MAGSRTTHTHTRLADIRNMLTHQCSNEAFSVPVSSLFVHYVLEFPIICGVIFQCNILLYYLFRSCWIQLYDAFFFYFFFFFFFYFCSAIVRWCSLVQWLLLLTLLPLSLEFPFGLDFLPLHTAEH